LIGAFFLLFGALRMGWVAAFIPTPVMRGFIEGLVCVTIIGQVPHLLGIDGAAGNFFAKLWFVLQRQSSGKLSKTTAGRLTRRSPGARGGEARPAVSRVRGDRTADRLECALSLGQILVSASATRWNTQSRVTEYGRPRPLKFPGGAAARRR
jgi:hypothetical protein